MHSSIIVCLWVMGTGHIAKGKMLTWSVMQHRHHVTRSKCAALRVR